jgi:hypothetical protein
MVLTTESERLHRDLQVNHREHLRAELNLAKTLLEFSVLYCKAGDTVAAGRSIRNFEMSIHGALEGISRIGDLSLGERSAVMAEIDCLEREMAKVKLVD